MNMDFIKFPKIPRYSRECIITEKIDGTNGQIYIEKVGEGAVPDAALVLYDNELYFIRAGSRSRWLTQGNDNHGFCKWVYANGYALIRGLGEGRHYGEWFGEGIQRGYGLDHKRFALFNVMRWDRAMFERYKLDPWTKLTDKQRHDSLPPTFSPPPECCHVVPVIGVEYSLKVDCWQYTNQMKYNGSYAVPGYNNPEGIVIYHTQGNVLFKRTIEDDDAGKNN